MGRPLIHWTVRAAIDSGLMDRVIVSTDDPEIAEAGIKAGAEVPFLRPAHLATSHATSLDVVSHMLESLQLAPDYLVLLQPTSPLRGAQDLRAAYEIIENSDAPAVVSVAEFEKPWPVLRKVDSKGVLGTLSQPSEGVPTHLLNGAIYFLRLRPFLEARNFTPPGTLAYTMSSEKSVDIDSPMDFAIARTIASQYPELFPLAD
jgi:CMP-N-acetylneuraminic acid synthetase